VFLSSRIRTLERHRRADEGFLDEKILSERKRERKDEREREVEGDRER